MTDFSRDPDDVLGENVDAGYVGLHFLQGVPLLDRDLNLVQDLAAATVRRVLSEYLGSGVAPVRAADGTAANDAFQVKAMSDPNRDNDFVVAAGSAQPGRCLVGGLEATITADRAYSGQALPPLRAPTAGNRVDTVYLDVFLTTDVSGPVMENADDVVVQTSVRLRPAWLARVAVGTDAPPAPAGHGHLPLATLHRQAGREHITSAMIFDARALLLSVADLRRLLLDPVITTGTAAGHVGDQVKITGRNFQITPDEPVTVFFDTTPAAPPTVAAAPGGQGLTQLTTTVPAFTPPLTNSPEVPLTVLTGHGSVVQSFRILT